MVSFSFSLSSDPTIFYINVLFKVQGINEILKTKDFIMEIKPIYIMKKNLYDKHLIYKNIYINGMHIYT